MDKMEVWGQAQWVNYIKRGTKHATSKSKPFVFIKGSAMLKKDLQPVCQTCL